MLGEVLRCIRIVNDTTLTSLSQEFDISQGYLSDIERGKKEATMEILKMYSQKFDIPLSGILFFYENKEQPKKFRRARYLLGKNALKIIKYLSGDEYEKNALSD